MEKASVTLTIKFLLLQYLFAFSIAQDFDFFYFVQQVIIVAQFFTSQIREW